MENDHAGPPPLDVIISSSSGTIALRVRGEVDAATVDVLQYALEVVENEPQLVVDLTATTFIDIAGVRALAACAKRRRAFGRDVLFLAPPPATEWILQMAPFCRDLHWEPREDRSAAPAGA